MPAWADLDALRTAVSRPYAIELAGHTEPADVITAYADLRPIVLWGSWLGDEVIIGVDPFVELGGLDAVDCWPALSTFPSPGEGSAAIGGCWFTVLGYDPGTSWVAFCDSVLRRRGGGSWVFESSGLSGRETSAERALAWARAAVEPDRAPAYDGTVLSESGSSAAVTAGIGPLSPVIALDRVADDHVAGVERVIGRIRAGEVYQLNLCTRLTAELRESPLELFVRTAGVVRPAYGAHLPTGPDTTLVSLSPERFVTVADGVVTTSPIKGTTKRSEDPDGALLRSSTKDAAENIMITDLMRNDLSQVCVPGSVTVTGLLEVQAHPGVWHLVSTVTGVLAAGVGPAELLAASFPPGSVTGAPKSSAVRAIAAEEPVPRGAYTGAAGVVTADGRAELSVLIRTFEASAGRVELGVGGGITVDSVPVREWRECLHKAEPLARAAGSGLVAGLDLPDPPLPAELLRHGVFESILVQAGRPVRLADHLARLARSVRELYAAELPDDLGPRLLALCAGWSETRAALRVHVRPSAVGEVDVESSVRPLGPRMRTCTLSLATRSAVSWRHKWVDRAGLQAAEELTAPALPYFVDPLGRLAETSRGNLFVLGTDDVWRTPPATEWVLPGVTRRALLDLWSDRGVPYEITPVTRDDLVGAGLVVWTSSLSGLVTVTQIDDHALACAVGRAAVDPADWSRWLAIG